MGGDGLGTVVLNTFDQCFGHLLRKRPLLENAEDYICQVPGSPKHACGEHEQLAVCVPWSTFLTECLLGAGGGGSLSPGRRPKPEGVLALSPFKDQLLRAEQAGL